MNLRKAQSYLQHVVEHTEAIAFRRYCGGVGRTSQVKTQILLPCISLSRWIEGFSFLSANPAHGEIWQQPIH